jgi:hypothetical protein
MSGAFVSSCETSRLYGEIKIYCDLDAQFVKKKIFVSFAIVNWPHESLPRQIRIEKWFK